MKKIILGLVFLFLLSSCYIKNNSIETSGASITNLESKGLRRILTKDDLKMDWELDEQGINPYDNKVHLRGNFVLQNKDVVFIFPKNIKSGSKVYVYEDKIISRVRQKQNSCFSKEYGWMDQANYLAYCNVPITTDMNGNILAQPEKTKQVFQISNDYFIRNFANRAVVYWNETEQVTGEVKRDVTNKFNYLNYQSIYGSHNYYVKNVSGDIDFEIVLNVSKEDLPLKYTICFGDINNRTLDFCLDPTITASRTWTVEKDFTNGTVRSNITADTDLSIKLNEYDYSSALCGVYLNMSDNVATQVNPCTLGDTISNLADYTASGFYNGAYDFEEANVDYMAIDDPGTGTNIDPTTSLSVGFWMKPESVSGQNQYVILEKDSAWGIKIRVDGGSGCTAGNECLCFLKGGISTTCSNTVQAVAGAWQRIDIVYDGAAGGKVYFYINGTLGQAISLTGSMNVNNNDLFIGSNQAHTDNIDFDGIIDDIYIMKANSSASVISARFNAGKKYRNDALYSDRRGWTPQVGNKIRNISVALTTTGTQTVQFRYNKTNASLPTSSWTTLSTSGTNTVLLPGVGTANDAIYYQFAMSDSSKVSTPRITSYTIYEASDGGAPPPATSNSKATIPVVTKIIEEGWSE